MVVTYVLVVSLLILISTCSVALFVYSRKRNNHAQREKGQVKFRGPAYRMTQANTPQFLVRPYKLVTN
jgi:hypothetical protein